MRISDWSSDVCSSDLALASPILIMFMLAVMQIGMTMQAYSALREVIGSGGRAAMVAYQDTSDGVMSETQVEDMLKTRARSEARREGQEDVSTCRSRWSPYH